jgi:peptidoglycan/LPS O-acetylase OafA/YrhL
MRDVSPLLSNRNPSKVEKKHNPALDGVRGLAIALVLLCHGTYYFIPSSYRSVWLINSLTVGWMGVDLFFVLSGFLITGILLETVDAQNRARSFYARRVLRIFPIYYLVLVSFVVARFFFSSVRNVVPFDGWRDILAYFAYFPNWLPLWHNGQLPISVIAHFWSLGVEEQFYFIWPFIIWRLRNPRKMLVLAVSGCVLMLVLRFALMLRFGSGIWYMSLPMTRGDGLLMGAGIAAWTSMGKRVRPSVALLAFVVGAGYLIVMSVRNPQFWDVNQGFWLLTLGLSAVPLMWGATVATAAMPDSSLLALWRLRPLRTLGKYSYGIYVYHVPIYYAGYWTVLERFRIHGHLSNVFALVSLGCVMLASLGVAVLSYHLIEARFLRLKSYFAPVSHERVQESRLVTVRA